MLLVDLKGLREHIVLGVRRSHPYLYGKCVHISAVVMIISRTLSHHYQFCQPGRACTNADALGCLGGGFSSSQLNMDISAPQGSVPGPILFFVYSNDISACSNFETTLYA